MLSRGPSSLTCPAPEPWGARLWLSVALVALVAAALQTYGIATWPMADDEVPSLVELGLVDISAETFSVPSDQVGRLTRTLPVWYGSQGLLIDLLPGGEVRYRVPSVVYGVLSAVLVFLAGARWRGLWFAAAASILVNASVPFVYLAQLNRFYSLPLLLLLGAIALIWFPRGGVGAAVATAAVTILTVLSHNITVALFVLAALAAAPLWFIGWVPSRVLLRSSVAALVSVGLYLGYVRPLVEGWNSTGNPTPVFVSFAAHAGLPALGLAAFGGWLTLWDPGARRTLAWWLLVFAGSLCAFQLANIGWNPRYFTFFLPAMWMLGAYAMAFVAAKLGSPKLAIAWYLFIVLLLLPNLLSHFRDGSRHDYRQAAAVLARVAAPGQVILSDDAETISYYLQDDLRPGLRVRTKVRDLPAAEFYLVTRANAWMSQPTMPDRQMQLLAEIATRRYDGFSHIVRVHRVAAREAR